MGRWGLYKSGIASRHKGAAVPTATRNAILRAQRGRSKMVITAVKRKHIVKKKLSAPSLVPAPFAAFPTAFPHVIAEGTLLVLADALQWMGEAKENSLH